MRCAISGSFRPVAGHEPRLASRKRPHLVGGGRLRRTPQSADNLLTMDAQRPSRRPRRCGVAASALEERAHAVVADSQLERLQRASLAGGTKERGRRCARRVFSRDASLAGDHSSVVRLARVIWLAQVASPATGFTSPVTRSGKLTRTRTELASTRGRARKSSVVSSRMAGSVMS